MRREGGRRSRGSHCGHSPGVSSLRAGPCSVELLQTHPLAPTKEAELTGCVGAAKGLLAALMAPWK